MHILFAQYAQTSRYMRVQNGNVGSKSALFQKRLVYEIFSFYYVILV